MTAHEFAQKFRGVAIASAMLAALAGCDETIELVEEAADKGGSDVPEEAREQLDPETLEQLHKRAQGQNFN